VRDDAKSCAVRQSRTSVARHDVHLHWECSCTALEPWASGVRLTTARPTSARPRRRRNASNISLQASPYNDAVVVNAPSRSNSHARIELGNCRIGSLNAPSTPCTYGQPVSTGANRSRWVSSRSAPRPVRIGGRHLPRCRFRPRACPRRTPASDAAPGCAPRLSSPTDAQFCWGAWRNSRVLTTRRVSRLRRRSVGSASSVLQSRSARARTSVGAPSLRANTSRTPAS
jgi:hypothetical protein